MPLETISAKIPKVMKTKLKQIAKARHTKLSTLIKEALQHTINQNTPKSNSNTSAYDLMKDIVDSPSPEDLHDQSPKDLSFNKKYLKDLGKK